MTCLDVTMLDRYAAGQLGDGEASGAERHLDSCDACRRALAALAVAGPIDGPVDGVDGALASPGLAVTAPGMIGDTVAPSMLTPSGMRTLPRRPDGVAPSRVGRHVVLSRLGAGGMGVVYAAYDPDLDRKVALKLVRGGDDEARARFLREAQAMARLDHPGVITVFDVGVVDGQAYIAMELVEGGTLRTWMLQRRPWREVIAMLTAAGHGLAAAHAAGIIHRDFKPDNVLLAGDGSVRVTDFGLARAAEDGPASSPRVDLAGSSGVLDAALTRTGAVLGTPAYMAPEQYAGSVVDERADQFAFCVALFEALYGSRPFAGDTPRQLALAVSAGQIRALEGPVPAWVRRIVVQGLAADPAQRWPSMSALLDALGADPARRRRRIATATVVAAAAVLGLGAAWRVGAGGRVESCRPDPTAFAGAWDEERRAAVRAAFVGTGAPFAADAFERVAAELDHRTRVWGAAVHAACTDTRVRRTVTEPMLERRMACLAQRQAELRALATQLSQVDASAAAEAPRALARLSSIEACADLTRLLEGEPPPADPRLADVQHAIADASAARGLGQIEKAHALARAARPRTDELGWAPARARLLLLIGETARLADRRDEARATLLEAVRAADVARDDAARARAWIELADLAVHDPDPAASAQAHEHAAGAAARSGDPALSAALDRSRGTFEAERGDYVAATAMFVRARDWMRTHRGATSPDTLDLELDIANVLSDTGQLAEAVARLTEVLDPLRRAYGASHPSVARALIARAVANGKLKRRDAFDADFTAALAIQRGAFGEDSAPVAETIRELGTSRLDTGDAAGALEALRRSRAIYARVFGEGSIEEAKLVGRIGAALNVAGDHQAAAEHLRQARETLVRRFGETQSDLPYLAAEELNALLALKRYPETLERAHWYVAITEKIRGIDSFHAAVARAGAADMELNAGGDPARAVRLLEQSWAHLMTQEPFHTAAQQYNLARALWRSGGDRKRARELMNQALATFVAAGDRDAQAEIKAWLAHPR